MIDFVSVLQNLKKALQFDSSDVSGVIEDLDLLLKDFQRKISEVSQEYLDAGEDGNADERLTKTVTFDSKTLEGLRSEKGYDEGKVFNLVRGLQKEIDESPDQAPILQPLKERAERIFKDMESRHTTGMVAMDLMAAIAIEKDKAAQEAKDTGLSPKAFAVFWTLRSEQVLTDSGLSAIELAKEIETLLLRFPIGQ